MSIVVTGMRGLLGRHISRALVSRGEEIHELRARFQPSTEAGVVPIETAALADVLRHAAPDFLYHLAGISRTSRTADFYRVNTLYAAVLLDALTAADLGRTTLVLVGSAAEYGPMSASSVPASEDGQTAPADFYGASKLAQTVLGLTAARQGRRIVVVRPSNMIGPGMPRSLALGSFVHQLGAIARGERDGVLEVGDLSGTRDFIDVRDAAEFIIRVVETPAAIGQVVNVCSGRGFPMERIVGILLNLFERSGHGTVRVEQREIAATAASSKVHVSCNRRLRDLLGAVEYTPIESTLSWILKEELEGG